MMKCFKRSAGILLLFLATCTTAQQPDTTKLDLRNFAASITGNEPDDFEKARKLLSWLSTNFEWKATDYQNRTVNQIIARKGGNCFELARVYMAMIQACGIRYRPMAEINIHPVTPQRQETAAGMVKEKGYRYSVFGLQHNDHRWVEIYDGKNDRWEPADPSVGVIGLEDWLKARVWFGERRSIDTAITNDMIVPFAIFLTGTDKAPIQSRTSYYLIDQFNALYDGKLSGLPEWKQWVEAIAALEQPAMNAFLGKENLHEHQSAINRLAEVYAKLKRRSLALTNAQ